MEKVFGAYATRRGIAPGSLRFLLDGEKIGPDQTPKMLELEDQDQIDCMLEQVREALTLSFPNSPLTHSYRREVGITSKYTEVKGQQSNTELIYSDIALVLLNRNDSIFW